jgi:hypothetical protein
VKIEVCGGGIDKDEKFYRLPMVEREVPENFIEKLIEDVGKNAVSLAGEGLVITLDPDVWKALKKCAGRLRSGLRQPRRRT